MIKYVPTCLSFLSFFLSLPIGFLIRVSCSSKIVLKVKFEPSIQVVSLFWACARKFPQQAFLDRYCDTQSFIIVKTINWLESGFDDETLVRCHLYKLKTLKQCHHCITNKHNKSDSQWDKKNRLFSSNFHLV